MTFNPNEALANARRNLGKYEDALEHQNPSAGVQAADELAWDVQALLEHLDAGGMLPDEWHRHRLPAFGENLEIDKLLHSVFRTAVQGGFGCWLDTVSPYCWGNGDGSDDLENFTVTVQGIGGDDFEPTVINRTVIVRGFERYLNGYDSGTPMSRLVLKAVVDPGKADFDSSGASAIVQVGLFGEEMFS